MLLWQFPQEAGKGALGRRHRRVPSGGMAVWLHPPKADPRQKTWPIASQMTSVERIRSHSYMLA